MAEAFGNGVGVNVYGLQLNGGELQLGTIPGHVQSFTIGIPSIENGKMVSKLIAP